ncbi:MAG: FAD-binding oxidoreductase, partial [Candidatus Electrothrix sp. EH2]|nr:FAD-binding oxidoreductase [Candidatus Electrothrix sp. EH2]
MSSFDHALPEWQQTLGSEAVLTDPEILESAQTATFATHQRVAAILQPENREEVQTCVKIANRYRIP